MSGPLHHGFKAMGGPCDLFIHADQDTFVSAAGELETEVRRLERKYSRFDPDSLISRLNRSAGHRFEVDAETAGLLDFADQCYAQSDGLFDITTGVLRRVWDFGSNQLPSPQALRRTLNHVGWSRVNWDGRTLALQPGMELDLGGLVKEFAADRLLALLAERGLVGLVNLAGDIRVTGPQPDGSYWMAGIRHPREPGQVVATLPLARGALATSGDYERYMVVNGQRYCHILHPATGMPVADAPASVSVVTDNCLLAGAVTTMAMLKGKDAEIWLAGLGVPYLLFDGSLTISGTLADTPQSTH